jgi:hypothetical protein
MRPIGQFGDGQIGKGARILQNQFANALFSRRQRGQRGFDAV